MWFFARMSRRERLLAVVVVGDPGVDPDDRLEPLAARRFIEAHHAEHVGQVGHGQRRLLVLGGNADQVVDAHEAVDDRVFGVDAQVGEGRGSHGRILTGRADSPAAARPQLQSDNSPVRSVQRCAGRRHLIIVSMTRPAPFPSLLDLLTADTGGRRDCRPAPCRGHAGPVAGKRRAPPAPARRAPDAGGAPGAAPAAGTPAGAAHPEAFSWPVRTRLPHDDELRQRRPGRRRSAARRLDRHAVAARERDPAHPAYPERRAAARECRRARAWPSSRPCRPSAPGWPPTPSNCWTNCMPTSRSSWSSPSPR